MILLPGKKNSKIVVIVVVIAAVATPFAPSAACSDSTHTHQDLVVGTQELRQRLVFLMVGHSETIATSSRNAQGEAPRGTAAPQQQGVEGPVLRQRHPEAGQGVAAPLRHGERAVDLRIGPLYREGEQPHPLRI